MNPILMDVTRYSHVRTESPYTNLDCSTDAADPVILGRARTALARRRPGIQRKTFTAKYGAVGTFYVGSPNRDAAVEAARALRMTAHTNLLCSIAAAMKLAKRGCGSKGRDFNSG